MTGFRLGRLGCVEALFGADFLKVFKGGLLGRGEMANVTSQPGLSFCSIWRWRTDGTSALISSEWIHVVVVLSMYVNDHEWSKQLDLFCFVLFCFCRWKIGRLRQGVVWEESRRSDW